MATWRGFSDGGGSRPPEEDGGMARVGVGIIGSRFVADLHADALRRVRDADLLACASPNADHVGEHAEICVEAARAGKHVVVEKPLCLNLQEADRMIAACREAGVKLMYAETLCFTPKYVRAKRLVAEGAVG